MVNLLIKNHDKFVESMREKIIKITNMIVSFNPQFSRATLTVICEPLVSNLTANTCFVKCEKFEVTSELAKYVSIILLKFMFIRCIFSILLERIFSKFVCRMFKECVRHLFTLSLLNISCTHGSPSNYGDFGGKSNAWESNVLKITIRPITFRISQIKA